MKTILIRHGKTQGNLEHRYIGSRTDEDLCPQGMDALKERAYPEVDGVFVSPMKRCIQTAAIIYPGKEIRIIDDLRECDFGAFEGRNYDELKDMPAYQAWLDSNGELPFPGGEDKKGFAKRCARSFDGMRSELPDGSYAFVIHGGTIMAIMEQFARPRGNYYDFQVQNGRGFILNGDGSYEVI